MNVGRAILWCVSVGTVSLVMIVVMGREKKKKKVKYM